MASQASTSYRAKVSSWRRITPFTWSFSSWYERRMAVYTAMPEAASGSQRSSHTRRDASTTSNGAFSKPHPAQALRPWRPALQLPGPSVPPMTPSASSVVDLCRREPELAQDLVVVLPEQRGVPLVHPRRPPGEPHGQGAVAGGSDHRVSTSSKKPPGCQLRQIGLVVGLHDLADRHAGVPQPLDDVVRRPGAAPLAQHARRSGRARAPGRPVARSGSAAQSGSPRAWRSASHCSSVRDGDRHPAVVPAVLVGTGDL